MKAQETYLVCVSHAPYSPKMPENLGFVVDTPCLFSTAKMKRDKENASKSHWSYILLVKTEACTHIIILWTHLKYSHLKIRDGLIFLSYETVKEN